MWSQFHQVITVSDKKLPIFFSQLSSPFIRGLTQPNAQCRAVIASLAPNYPTKPAIIRNNY